MFDKMLLQEGLAGVAVYLPNTKCLNGIKEIESAAKVKTWSIENYASEEGYNTEEAEQPAEPKAAPSPSAASEAYQNCTEL